MLDLQSHFKSNSSYCCHMHLYIWLMCVSNPLLACTFKLHSCHDNMLLHPYCCCGNSMPCPRFFLDAATCHDIVSMIPHAQGIVPLCIAFKSTCSTLMPHPSLSWCSTWHDISLMAHQIVSLQKALCPYYICHLVDVIGYS